MLFETMMVHVLIPAPPQPLHDLTDSGSLRPESKLSLFNQRMGKVRGKIRHGLPVRFAVKMVLVVLFQDKGHFRL